MADGDISELDRLTELEKRVRAKGGDQTMLDRLAGLGAKLHDPKTEPDLPIPEPTPPGPPRKLTVGMACHSDFDGVFFTVNALRMYHPEVTADTEILILDNAPWRPEAHTLKQMENSIENCRYVPAGEITGTAVRDRIFREANSEWVMVIDSHVLLAAGALARLLEFLDGHADSNDLYQGPLVGADMRSPITHMNPEWNEAMFGVWGVDERGTSADADPFPIPMHGLGLFVCRRQAWPGFNPRFRGFGGEEGYIHEKFRRNGAETICLPFLRWLHRFERPAGPVYEVSWEDRIRNYMIGFREVGLDEQPILDHFESRLGADALQEIVDRVRSEMANPFSYFDAIFCINLDSQPDRWHRMKERFERLGIGDRVERISAVKTTDSHHVGCALSHRKAVEMATKRGLENVLVFEDDATFRGDAVDLLERVLEELNAQGQWKILYLGAMNWYGPVQPVDDCETLLHGDALTEAHAIGYHRSFFEELLRNVPDTETGVREWIESGPPAIDQWFAHDVHGPKYLVTPQISYQEGRLPFIRASEAACYD